MKRFKHLVILFLMGIITWGTSSCYEVYPYESDLLINVQGLLSGNPRSGLPVQIFETAYDAEQLIYPVTPVVYTDDFGEVLIIGLDPSYEYYVRVDALLATKIKSTGNLKPGANTMTVRFL